MSDFEPGGVPPEPERRPEPPREEPRAEYSTPPMSPPQDFESNYPRAGLGFMGFGRPPGVYWDSLTVAVNMISKNLGVYALSSLLGFVVIGLAYGPLVYLLFGSMMLSLSNPKNQLTGNPLLMVGPSMLLQYVVVFVYLCFISLGVRHSQGNTPQVSDLFIPLKRFRRSAYGALITALPSMVLQLISDLAQAAMGKSMIGAAVLVSLLALVGFLIQITLYGPMLLGATASIFSDRSPFESISKVFQLLKWNSLLLGLLVFVASIASALGAFACCIGILFSYPILPNVLALHMLAIFPEEALTLNSMGA